MKEFLATDEDGSATVWSLFWTLVFLFLAGISIDASNAYRFKSALQATADASSTGAILGFLNEAKYAAYSGDTSVQTPTYRGEQVAVGLAVRNMNTSRNGTVVPASNVEFGRWNGSSFSTTSSLPVNAARVQALRTQANSNELPTLLLGRFNLIAAWDVGATSITEAYFNNCAGGEGIMAGGGLQIASNNDFHGDLCLHGEQYLDLNNGNDFYTTAAGTPGLSFGPPGAVCSGFGNCQTSGFTNVTGGNQTLTASMIEGPSTRMPDVAGMIASIGSVIANPNAYTALNNGLNHYIPANLTTNPDRMPGSEAYLADTTWFDPATFPLANNSASVVNGVVRVEMSATQFQNAVANAATVPIPGNVIYEVNSGCNSGNARLDLNTAVTIDDIVLVTNCRVLFSNNIIFTDSTLYTTYAGNGNNSAIHGSSGVQLGGGTCNNAQGGSVLIAVSDDIDFGAGFAMNNSQVIGGRNVEVAAQPNGMEGTNILAANDVRLTSNGEWQGCPAGSAGNRIIAYSYRLVY